MRCVFCNKLQQPGQGIIFVYSDGRVVYFCSSKCRRNYRMKRDPKKIKWAQKGLDRKPEKKVDQKK
jgi:large subunit ribosomal protein L24e